MLTSFIHAHKEAQSVIEEWFLSTDDPMLRSSKHEAASEIRSVISESEDEVEQAQVLLGRLTHLGTTDPRESNFTPRGTPKPNSMHWSCARELVKLMETQQLASILLRDQFHTVMKLEKDGIITSKEACEEIGYVYKTKMEMEQAIYQKSSQNAVLLSHHRLRGGLSRRTTAGLNLSTTGPVTNSVSMELPAHPDAGSATPNPATV